MYFCSLESHQLKRDYLSNMLLVRFWFFCTCSGTIFILIACKLPQQLWRVKEAAVARRHRRCVAAIAELD